MEVVLSWNKWRNFVLMLCFFLSGHFPTGCYQPCTFTVSCFILVVFKQMIRAGGRPEGWGRILNAAKPCQFFKMSPALLNTGRIHLFLTHILHWFCTVLISSVKMLLWLLLLLQLLVLERMIIKHSTLIFYYFCELWGRMVLCESVDLFLCLWLGLCWPQAHASLNSALPVLVCISWT